MKSAIYFELDEKLKRQFNVSLAEKGEIKTKVLIDMILQYVKGDKNEKS